MLELKHISKQFEQRMILEDISIMFPDTGFIGIQGESGCGKSTLLYIIGMLDDHFDGEVLYNGHVIADRQEFIQKHVSLMMQNKDMISAMTVKENILLASQVGCKKYHLSQVYKIAKQLGIFELLNKYPSQLSGGQLKRVSIARALIKKSSIVICDEPTGALHETQAHEVMKLLKKISEDRLVIIVSHDPQLLQMYCDSVLHLKGKRLIGNVYQGKKISVCDEPYQYHSLFIYLLRQLLYQRNKLLFLFLFQWILIVSFFLMVTAMNGIGEAIAQSELHSVSRYTMTIENKERVMFDEIPQIENTKIQYQYSLEQLQIYSNQESLNANLSFLPQQTKHIHIQKGRLPIKENEVIVSQSAYDAIENKNLRIEYGDFQMELKVVGVLSPLLFQSDEIYCLPALQEKISFLKDEYTLLVEVQKENVKEMYHLLSEKYYVYSDVIERTESYQSILSLAQLVASLFIGISFLVSILLIGIVESILYYERKHDMAYLLSLGLKSQRLMGLSFIEAVLLGGVIAIGGNLLAGVIYWFINHVYKIQDFFNFHLQLNTIWLSQYDLFILIVVIYILMVVVGALLPIRQMIKINMIDVLREE